MSFAGLVVGRVERFDAQELFETVESRAQRRHFGGQRVDDRCVDNAVWRGRRGRTGVGRLRRHLFGVDVTAEEVHPSGLAFAGATSRKDLRQTS